MRKLLGILVVLGLLPCHTMAQALANRVPGDAVIYVGWKGADDLGPEYPSSHLKAVVDESNVGQLLHQTIPQLLAKFESMPPAAEVAKAMETVVGPMWGHPSALYVGKLSVDNGNPAPPRVYLICQAGADAQKMKAGIDDLLQQNPSPIPINVSLMGDTVVVSLLAPADQLPSGTDGQSLAENAKFKAAMSEVGGEGVLSAYVDVAAIVSFGDQMAQQHTNPQGASQWANFRDSAGLSGLTQLSLAGGFDQTQWGTKVFIGAPEPRQGGLAQADKTPIADDILANIPATADLAGAFHIDLAGIVGRMHQTGSPQQDQEIENLLHAGSQQIGTDIEKELLPVFGTTWAYYIDPTTCGTGMGGITLLNPVKDPASARATLEKFEQGLQKAIEQQLEGKPVSIAFRQTTINGVIVNYLATPLVTPSWTIEGNILCIGLYPQVVASAALHIRQHDPSILTNAGFISLRDHLGGKDAVALSFVDLPKRAPEAYSGWRTLLSLDQASDLFGIDAPPALLPPLNELMKHLSPAGAITTIDAKGFHYRILAPFPGAELLEGNPMSFTTAEVAFMTSIMLPALNRAREQANRVKSASNLKQIGLGCLMYSNTQRNGAFPPSIHDLIKTQDLTPEVFINPRRSGSRPPPPGLTGEDLWNYVDAHSDYVYLGAGKKNTLFAHDIVAYEKPEGLKDGINILFGDGSVAFYPMEQAIEMINNARQGNPNLPKDGGL